MQWNRGTNAGFSEATPINKVNLNYLEGVNVEDEQNDPDSILNYARYAIEIRKRPQINEQVLRGKFEIVDMNHADVFAYRHYGYGEQLVCITNMRPYNVYFGFYDKIRDILLHNYPDIVYNDHVFELRPFETFLLRV